MVGGRGTKNNEIYTKNGLNSGQNDKFHVGFGAVGPCGYLDWAGHVHERLRSQVVGLDYSGYGKIYRFFEVTAVFIDLKNNYIFFEDYLR